jgi:uncharacterized membrane-anchored protein YitT (DUF2179 family)
MLTIVIMFTVYFAVAKSRGRDPVMWGFVGAGISALSKLTIAQFLTSFSATSIFSLFEIILLSLLIYIFMPNEESSKTHTHISNHNSTVDELVEAVLNEDVYRVRKLLNAGANPTEKRHDGYSAIDFARSRSLHEIHKILSEYATH